MELFVEEIDRDTARLVLTGRMDIAGSEAIDVRFAAAANSKRFLMVDMSGVTFLASIGIRSLFAKAKMASAHGGRLVIAAPQPNVAEVLDLTGVPQLIPIFGDCESARAHLATLTA
jgi:anti-anti-sigma factor